LELDADVKEWRPIRKRKTDVSDGLLLIHWFSLEKSLQHSLQSDENLSLLATELTLVGN